MAVRPAATIVRAIPTGPSVNTWRAAVTMAPAVVMMAAVQVLRASVVGVGMDPVLVAGAVPAACLGS